MITSIRTFFLHSDTSISSSHEQLPLPLQYLNQSAWQNGSSGGLIDALIQSLSSAAVWSLLKANTAQESSMGLPLKRESGARLTECLWTIDQGGGDCAAEWQTFGLKQHCSLIWWHWRDVLQHSSHFNLWWPVLFFIFTLCQCIICTRYHSWLSSLALNVCKF